MSFIENLKELDSNKEQIWLAGGCFWGTEDYLSNIKGVLTTEVGYANGLTENPSYEDVCSGETGFAEAVHVIFDKSLLSLEFLLDVYYKSIDPVSIDRQGNDIGSQYRTGIYYVDESQKEIIDNSIKILQEEFYRPIAIEVKKLENFYLAEGYHQKYLSRNPGGYCHISNDLLNFASGAKMYNKKPDGELRKELTDLQFRVTRQKATEPPFENQYDKVFDKGVYVDITTGEPLFLSEDKFDSGSGWPAFTKPINNHVVKRLSDNSNGMYRVEVKSITGDAHLGHVFEDGPKDKGGLRYCINSSSLKFIPFEDLEKEGYSYLADLF